MRQGYISGTSFKTQIGDLSILCKKVTLSITDNTAVAMDGGIPNGFVLGSVEANGDLELDANNLSVLIESAGRAGGFRSLGTFDMTFFAKTNITEMRVQAFGCRLKIESLLDIDSAGNDQHVTKIPFDVTSPNFIRINGVSYLDDEEIRDLV